MSTAILREEEEVVQVQSAAGNVIMRARKARDRGEEVGGVLRWK